MGRPPSKALKALTRYTYFPKELHRPQLGHLVALRAQQPPPNPQGPGVDTAHHQRERLRHAKVAIPDESREEGLVGPKGCPFKPNTPFLQRWMQRGWRDPLARVWVVQAGTPLPPSLVLVQQGDTQQWTIDPVGKQSLDELNDNINNFLQEHAGMVTAEQWRRAYRRATDVDRPVLSPRGEKIQRKTVVAVGEEDLEKVRSGPKLGVRFSAS